MNNSIKSFINKYIINVVNPIFSILIGYFLASIIISFFSPAVSSVKPVSLKNQVQAPPKIGYENLFLFGNPKVKVETKKQPIKTVPIYNLILQVKGIIKAENPKKSVAIIGKPNSSFLPYKTNEMIDRYTKLILIKDNYITVEHKGITTSFFVFDKNKNAELPKEFYSPKKPVKNNVVSKGNNISVNLPESFTPKLNIIRKKLKTNPMSLMNLFAGSPVFKNGKIQGIKIRPGSDKKLFKALNFKNNDIIISINGLRLNSPENLGKLLELTNNATVFNVDLERNKQKRVLTVYLP